MKVTMYELLEMVKDGKAPKKIKYEDRTYTLYLDEENNHYYQDDKCKYFMLSVSCFEALNNEVEILEEEKKIPENNFNYIYSCEDEHIMANFANIKTTLKDIIDYLKSKGDE